MKSGRCPAMNEIEWISPGAAALWMRRSGWGVFLCSDYARVERVTDKRVTIRIYNDCTQRWEFKVVRPVSVPSLRRTESYSATDFTS